MTLHKCSTLIAKAEVVLTQTGARHVVAGHGMSLALELEQQQHGMGQNYLPESVLNTYSGYEGFFRL